MPNVSFRSGAGSLLLAWWSYLDGDSVVVRVRAMVDGVTREAYGVVEVDPWCVFVSDLEELAESGEGHAQLVSTEYDDFSLIFEDWDLDTDSAFHVSCELRGFDGDMDGKPFHCGFEMDRPALDSVREALITQE